MTVKSRVYSDGGYIYLDNELVKGWHKCAPGEFFAYQADKDQQLEGKMAHWIGAHIPADLMAKALAAIAYKPDTEVDLCLYYSKAEGKWILHLPQQRATGASVQYDDTDYKEPKGYIFQGTIHSHPNMGAFWSGIDYRDQTGKSGIHIVVGTDHGKMRQMLCSLWINAQVYDASDVVDLPEGDTLPELSKEWIDILNTPMPEPEPEVACTPTYTLEGHTYSTYNDHFREAALNEYLERYHLNDWDYDTKTPEWEKDRNIDMSMLYEGATDREKLYDICWLLRDLGYEDKADEIESIVISDLEQFSDSETYDDFDFNVEDYLEPKKESK